jgi:Zn finger protein HypA/HybF involved in hydrogenase expression
VTGWEFAAPLTAPLAFNLVAVFGAWIYYGLVGKGKADREVRRRIFRCAKCGHVYEEKRDMPMAKCPVCKAFNESVRR